MSDGWRIEERPRTIPPYLPVLRACPFLRVHSVSLSVSPSLFIRFLASHGCEECRGRDCGCSCNRATLCRIFQADSRGRPGTSLFPGVQNTMQSKTCLIFRQERLLSLFFLFFVRLLSHRETERAPCPSFSIQRRAKWRNKFRRVFHKG